MKTQVNFEVKLPDTGSVWSGDLERLMEQLKGELQRTAENFLADRVVVPPVVLIRGPSITQL